MKKLLILTAAVLTLQAIPALAEDKEPMGGDQKRAEHPMFAEQDLDKNGTVSEEEFLDFGKKKFGEIDSDKNGQITKEEAQKHHEARRGKWKEKRQEMKEKRQEMRKRSEGGSRSDSDSDSK